MKAETGHTHRTSLDSTLVSDKVTLTGLDDDLNTLHTCKVK